MRLTGTFVVLAVVLALAGPVAAVPLTPTTSPLPGSTFQGADGNQVNDSGFIDWQQLQADGRVVHNPDPNAQDSEFTGGKENSPKDWDIGLTAGGVTPGKANILDAWSSVDQVGGDTFLYFAFTRNADTGTTHLAVELNEDARLWNNGHANIPCRRTATSPSPTT